MGRTPTDWPMCARAMRQVAAVRFVWVATEQVWRSSARFGRAAERQSSPPGHRGPTRLVGLTPHRPEHGWCVGLGLSRPVGSQVGLAPGLGGRGSAGEALK